MKYEINLFTWFQRRELDFCPKHFVTTKTPITPESKIWIEEKLTGRYSYILFEHQLGLDFDQAYPAFEDSKEAVLYELTWST